MTHNEARAARRARAEQMAALYRAGQTLQAIGTAYGITRERVRQLLAEIGVARTDRPKPPGPVERRKERRATSIRTRWGIEPEVYAAMVERWGASSNQASPFRKYQYQKRNARTRGIEWAFTFGEWWSVWERSGKWERRGRGQGFCMARYGDTGPYSADNVYICTISQNFSDSYNVDHPRRPRSRRLPVKAQSYKTSKGPRWMVVVPQLPGKKYFGGFPSRDVAEQYGISLLRAA